MSTRGWTAKSTPEPMTTHRRGRTLHPFTHHAALTTPVPALKTAIALAWIPFWIYWLVPATSAKESRPGRRWTPVGGLTAVAVILVVRVFRTGSLAVHS